MDQSLWKEERMIMKFDATRSLVIQAKRERKYVPTQVEDDVMIEGDKLLGSYISWIAIMVGIIQTL